MTSSRSWWPVLVLIGGPLIAFAAMALGCVPPWRLLDAMCGHNGLISFFIFTAAGWLIMIVIWALFHVRATLFETRDGSRDDGVA
jgi:hypothetical protein